MTENEISAIVVDSAFKVHTTLGFGLLESVYEAALCIELAKRGLKVERQKGISVFYDGQPIGFGFRADILVEGKVILEIKSLGYVPEVAYKALLSYLRASDLRLGLLINFGQETLKDGLRRIANNLI